MGDSEVPELRSESTIAKAQEKAAKQAAKRAEKARQKVLDAVETNKYKNPPDWTHIERFGKLSEVAKPICTRYVYDALCKYPGYVVLVGKQWFRANKALGRLLDSDPALPLVLDVWDTNNTTSNGHKIWGVKISKFE